ncbi:transmembrane protein [Pasteurella multocida]|nr:transmembrane protein [Pasteurella multocida]
MRTELDEEKELLIMKGNALRMKLYGFAKKPKADNSSFLADSVSQIASSLNQPVVRSLAVSLLSKKILSSKFLAYSALGAIALFLLNKSDKTE